jgi:hypothetical protein
MSFRRAKSLPAWRKLALETWSMPSSPAAYGVLDLDCEAALAGARDAHRSACCRARRMRASGHVSIRLFEGRGGSSPWLPITDVDWAMSPGLS